MSNIRLFHPENIIENTISLLSKEHTHYVANVMRMKRGSNINFFNKEGEWLSEIVFLDRDRVEVKFLKKLKEPTKNSNIELAICLVKKSPMDTILQKATELGVSKIIPIVSERTEVKELNYERERKNLTLYKNLLSNIEDVYVPKVYKSISTKRLLSMQWLKGENLLEFKRSENIFVTCFIFRSRQQTQ